VQPGNFRNPQGDFRFGQAKADPPALRPLHYKAETDAGDTGLLVGTSPNRRF